MSALRLFFEALPVLLAVAAIFSCGHKVVTTRRVSDRNIFLSMIVCSALLIAAQSSWTYTMLRGLSEGTDFANILWTCFNACTMLVFIASSRRKRR